MISILVQDILDKSSVSESETSYLGKARLVHYHAGSSLEFDIPRYHYNFITGINILSVSDNVESVTIKINSFVKTLPKKCFFSESDIQTKKMNEMIKEKNLLEAPLYIPESVNIKLIFKLNKTRDVIVPVLIEYGTVKVEELINISESKYIMHTIFNDKKIYFKKGYVYNENTAFSE